MLEIVVCSLYINIKYFDIRFIFQYPKINFCIYKMEIKNKIMSYFLIKIPTL